MAQYWYKVTKNQWKMAHCKWNMANAYSSTKSMKNGTLIIIDQKKFIGILHLHKKVNEKWQPWKRRSPQWSTQKQSFMIVPSVVVITFSHHMTAPTEGRGGRGGVLHYIFQERGVPKTKPPFQFPKFEVMTHTGCSFNWCPPKSSKCQIT